jgi:hypothetical protein
MPYQPPEDSAFAKLNPRADRKLQKAKRVLRRFRQDTPELNRLIRKMELDELDYEIAIELAIDDWNATTPHVGRLDIGTFPSLYLLILGASVQLLRMAGIYQSRNELNYSALGSSFTRANKTAYYIQWLQQFAQEWETKKVNFKIAQNVELGYSGKFSEYDLIGYDF